MDSSSSSSSSSSNNRNDNKNDKDDSKNGGNNNYHDDSKDIINNIEDNNKISQGPSYPLGPEPPKTPPSPLDIFIDNRPISGPPQQMNQSCSEEAQREYEKQTKLLSCFIPHQLVGQSCGCNCCNCCCCFKDGKDGDGNCCCNF